MDAQVYPDGISVIMITLDDEDKISSCLDKLAKCRIDEIVIVDGGSTDKTVEIAKTYTDRVFITEKGMGRQHIHSVKMARFKYLVGIEADTSFTPEEFDRFVDEFKNSSYVGMQPRKIINKINSYMDLGLDTTLRIRHGIPGPTNFICGPTIYKTQFYMDHCVNSAFGGVDFDGYCFDTAMNDYWNDNGFKLGISKAVAVMDKHMSFKKFITKQMFYGYGDHDYYSLMKGQWKFPRKIKSVFHVFRTYGLKMPIKAVLIGRPTAIPFYLMCVIFRYFGWFRKSFLTLNGEKVEVS